MKIQKNVSLARRSTFGIGGFAREIIEVSSREEIEEALRLASRAQGKNSRWRVFAGGSNIVFPDEGMDETLIRIRGGRITNNELRITADAGAPLMDVVRYSIERGLQGLETLSGIPGTIGGAVYGNAGAYGRSVSESVDRIEVCDLKSDGLRVVSREQCRFGYRESIFKKRNWVILRVFLRLEKGDSEELARKSKGIVTIREKKYRPGLRCPGSFFKNVLVKHVSKKSLSLIDRSKTIEGKIPSGYLLEEVGAKGMCEGGICIANFHGNLFVNTGGGTAREVKALARKLTKKVRDRFGIELEEEIRYF